VPTIYVFVDSKTHDGTFDIAKKYARAEIINNSKHTMDGAIQEISQSLSAEWILRIDDDELPSKGLISLISDRVDNYEMEGVGFRRFQCAISKNGKRRVVLKGIANSGFFRPVKGSFCKHYPHSGI